MARQSNEGYWVPSDAHADDPSSFISNSDILALLNRMAPRQLALISDSCFSGSLIASDADRFRGRVERLVALAEREPHERTARVLVVVEDHVRYRDHAAPLRERAR